MSSDRVSKPDMFIVRRPIDTLIVKEMWKIFMQQGN